MPLLAIMSTKLFRTLVRFREDDRVGVAVIEEASGMRRLLQEL